MKNINHATAKQSGVSLIELMVSIALGLLLVNGALEVLLSSRNTARNNDELSRIQENGRFAMEILARNIRMAGYRDPNNGVIDERFHSGACTAAFANCTDDGGDDDAIETPNVIDQNSFDRIAIAIDPIDGVDTDCTGAAVPENDLIANLFYIDRNNGVNSLFCRGFNIDTGAWITNAQPFVDGIDTMQILYGETDAGGTIKYSSAGNVTNWNNIRSVRIALLVSSGEPNGQDVQQARNFTLLDAPDIASNDRFNRQIFNTTVTINNTL